MKSMQALILMISVLGSATALACPTNPKGAVSGPLTSTPKPNAEANRAANVLRQVADTSSRSTTAHN